MATPGQAFRNMQRMVPQGAGKGLMGSAGALVAVGVAALTINSSLFTGEIECFNFVVTITLLLPSSPYFGIQFLFLPFFSLPPSLPTKSLSVSPLPSNLNFEVSSERCRSDSNQNTNQILSWRRRIWILNSLKLKILVQFISFPQKALLSLTLNQFLMPFNHSGQLFVSHSCFPFLASSSFSLPFFSFSHGIFLFFLKFNLWIPIPFLFFHFFLVVDGGHRAVKFSRINGVQKEVFAEGMHFMIPWIETPIDYDVRAKPRNIASLTGTKGIEERKKFISPQPFQPLQPLEPLQQ